MARVGAIGVVQSFADRDENGVKWQEVKVDIGDENMVTADYYPPPGFESRPIVGDYAFLADGPGTGGWICTGFRDPELGPQTSSAGEVAFFSRTALGTVAAKVLLKTDGSIELNDGAAVLGADGVLTVSADVVGGGISLKTHTHTAGLLVDSLSSPCTGTTAAP